MTEGKDILDASRSGARFGGPSFSLRNRAVRAVWRVSWFLLAGWTPPFMHSWRAMLLRLFGARIGVGARIYGSARIWLPANLVIGENAVIGPGANCYCMATITIGPNATISQNAHLCAGGHDIDSPHFQLVARPITIGDSAWVAADAFVGPGVSIGSGAVLGARGVAAKDLQSMGVYVGNPARLLRYRSASAVDGQHEWSRSCTGALDT